MGTSVSQASPKTTDWRAVATCYESDQITVDRAANEVWYAATSGESTMESQIKSSAVFACYELTQSKISPELMHHALSEISAKHDNSMVVEYAKRATLIASQGPQAAEQWPRLFFKELTNYLVSRDASGYIGPASRSKGVGDLIALKRSVGKTVEEKLGSVRMAAKNESDWSGVVTVALKALRRNK